MNADIPVGPVVGSEQPVTPDVKSEKPTEGTLHVESNPAEIRHEDTVHSQQQPPVVSSPTVQSVDPVVSVEEVKTEPSSVKDADLTVIDDTKILRGDNEFIGEVRKIIREEKDEPYNEEEESEDLNKKYLSSRFGVVFEHDKDKK